MFMATTNNKWTVSRYSTCAVIVAQWITTTMVQYWLERGWSLVSAGNYQTRGEECDYPDCGVWDNNTHTNVRGQMIPT